MKDLDSNLPVHDAQSMLRMITGNGRHVFEHGKGCLYSIRGYQLPHDIAYRHGEELSKIFTGTVFVANFYLEDEALLQSVSAYTEKQFFKRYCLL